MGLLWIITIVFALLGMVVSGILKSKFTKYSKVALSAGLSGKEVAEKMLKDNGIYDVVVESVEGQLTDHYNPDLKTVNLSPEVYAGRSIAAAAIAAHECGHALQHAQAYSMLELRSRLVPVVNISSKVLHWVFILAFLGIAFHLFSSPIVLTVVIAAQSIITLFALITLPVEINASQRGLAYIESARLTRSDEEYGMAKDALTWAGLTYVVAALASIAQLAYFVLMSRRRS
jgi:hypothetical protein